MKHVGRVDQYDSVRDIITRNLACDVDSVVTICGSTHIGEKQCTSGSRVLGVDNEIR